MTNFESRYASNPNTVKQYSTSQLREEFLVEDIFLANQINLIYSHYDRFIVGGANPIEPLRLESIDPLKSDYFLERREIGVINVGGKGSILVDGDAYELEHKEALYIGRGKQKVVFDSQDKGQPALFYINSAPAHQTFPTVKVSRKEAKRIELGSLESSNDRTVYQLIVKGIVETCQLQMGLTELRKGSVWNTMPSHVHDRRMEAYFYLDIPEGHAVCHFMGQPQETRHIWTKNLQAVISPPWSIHSGSGTSNYSFIWGMAGENLDYGDMDAVAIVEMK